tara:strand:+ start:884 stop:1432 length:549 start_codon:yes stop_codon:yes gene_type:complete
MRLITKRLILRDFTIKDAKNLAENANDKSIWYFTENIPSPYKLKDAKWFINKCVKKSKEKPRTSYELGIELKDEKRIIGCISIFKVDRIHKRAGIGYWIGKKYRKLGLVSESEKAVLDFAFNKLKLNKIWGDAMVENKGSNMLFKNFGFRKIGIKKEDLIKKGKKKHVYTWELLKKDYKRLK